MPAPHFNILIGSASPQGAAEKANGTAGSPPPARPDWRRIEAIFTFWKLEESRPGSRTCPVLFCLLRCSSAFACNLKAYEQMTQETQERVPTQAKPLRKIPNPAAAFCSRGPAHNPICS